MPILLFRLISFKLLKHLLYIKFPFISEELKYRQMNISIFEQKAIDELKYMNMSKLEQTYHVSQDQLKNRPFHLELQISTFNNWLSQWNKNGI